MFDEVHQSPRRTDNENKHQLQALLIKMTSFNPATMKNQQYGIEFNTE